MAERAYNYYFFYKQRSQPIMGVFPFTYNLSDSIVLGAARSATISRGQVLTRAFADSILNAASRFAAVTNSFGKLRTLSDSISYAASRSVIVSRAFVGVRALSDSILNGASRFATVVRVNAFTRALSDSISYAASRTVTIAKSVVSHFARIVPTVVRSILPRGLVDKSTKPTGNVTIK